MHLALLLACTGADDSDTAKPADSDSATDTETGTTETGDSDTGDSGTDSDSGTTVTETATLIPTLSGSFAYRQGVLSDYVTQIDWRQAVSWPASSSHCTISAAGSGDAPDACTGCEWAFAVSVSAEEPAGSGCDGLATEWGSSSLEAIEAIGWSIYYGDHVNSFWQKYNGAWYELAYSGGAYGYTGGDALAGSFVASWAEVYADYRY